MADFLIIGGGIAGLSVAAELARVGSVELIEAETDLGYHASGRSAAMFLANYGNRVIRALNSASVPTHETAEILSHRGFLMVAAADRQVRFEREYPAFGAEEISVSEAGQLWPILEETHCTRAAWLDAAYDLDTDRLLQHYTRAARRRDARIHTGTRAERITKVPAGWQVVTGKGVFEAKRLVNAAGAWADRLAGLAGLAPLGLQPLRRSMARLPAPNGLDTRNWPFVDEASEAWYAKPDAGAWLVSPADEDPVEPQDAWADDMVIAEGLARYQPFSTAEVTRVETTWAGLRSFAPDRTLVLGPDPAEPDFLWCAGQGGYGFQTAPAAARLLADLATGMPPEFDPEIVTALSPNRFSR